MFSFKSLVALWFALVAVFAVATVNAAPLTAEELAIRSTKLDALRRNKEAVIEKRLFAHEKAHLAADLAAYKIGRGTKHDNNPRDCGFGRVVCPASYNGIGLARCDFGNCKLECPRGLRLFFSRHPELPSFCA
ncbi:hypothetical protein JCM3766R1_004511 [Sporobolomyces carnicolor]